MQSFQAERRLRSAQFQDLHVYALLRSTMLLDDPPRTPVRSILKRILKFRDKPFPKPGIPLVLPLLGNDRFKHKVQQWMNQQIRDHKEFMIPFHLPSKSVVAGKFPSLRTRLYNHLQSIQQWDWAIQPECQCEKHLAVVQNSLSGIWPTLAKKCSPFASSFAKLSRSLFSHVCQLAVSTWILFLGRYMGVIQNYFKTA